MQVLQSEHAREIGRQRLRFVVDGAVVSLNLAAESEVGANDNPVSNCQAPKPSKNSPLFNRVSSESNFYPEEAAMYLSIESVLVILLVGLAAGWLAGQIVQGTGFGLVGDVIVGVIGAFIGDWLLPQLGIYLGVGIVSAILNAVIGAIVLLLIVRLVRGRGRWSGGLGIGWRRRWFDRR